MCLCFNNFIFIFVQWKLKIIEGDVWVVSLYYIKKRLNNCFNCTMKLNERPSSSRVLGCPASPPLQRVCWLLVHLRWNKKKNIWHGCRKIQQEQKNRKMYVLSELLLLLLLLLQQHRSSQIIFKQPNCFRHLLFSFFSKTFR